MTHQDTATATQSPRRKAVRARQQIIKSNRELMELLDKENPGASREELLALFCEKIADDPSRQFEAANFQGSYLYPSVVERKGQPATPPLPDAKELEEKTRATVKAAIAKRILLDSEFNGKKLRDMTCAECAELGGVFAAVAAKGKPDQKISEVVTQKQLDAICKGGTQ
jgi:hypothetical protein